VARAVRGLASEAYIFMSTTTEVAPAITTPRVSPRSESVTTSQAGNTLFARLIPVAAICTILAAVPNVSVLYHTWAAGDTQTLLIMVPHIVVSTLVIATLLTATIVFDEAH
jgi:hypothetical protein